MDAIVATLGKTIIGPLNGFHIIITVLYLLFQAFKSSGDKIQASHILVQTEKECKDIKDKILKGENFEELAAIHSKCPSGKSGGDLGKFGKGSMVPEFDAVCFDPKSKTNEILGPIKSQFGFHLIKITQKPQDAKKK